MKTILKQRVNTTPVTFPSVLMVLAQLLFICVPLSNSTSISRTTTPGQLPLNWTTTLWDNRSLIGLVFLEVIVIGVDFLELSWPNNRIDAIFTFSS